MGRVADLVAAVTPIEEAQEREDDPPLMLAVAKGQFGLVRPLVEAGADVTLASDRWSAPLMCAARMGHRDIFDDPAPLNETAERQGAREQFDRTIRLAADGGNLAKAPLRAAKRGQTGTLRHALERGADVN